MEEKSRASNKLFYQTEHLSVARTVLVFILYMLWFITLTTGGKITCSVPSAKLYTGTQLMCFFSEDLSQSKKDFTVYHYAKHGNPDAVLDCWWLNGKLDCFTRPGYEFNMVVTDRLTVRLPHVEDNQAGTYACQVAGYRPEHLNTCELAVTPALVAIATMQSSQLDVVPTEKGLFPDLKTTCLTTVEVLGQPATITCSFGSKPSETFLVTHIGVTGSKDYPLLCSLVNGGHTCEVLPEYTLEGEITTFAKLHIDNVTQVHLGRYQCRGLSVASDNEGHCDINIQDVWIYCSASRRAYTLQINGHPDDTNNSVAAVVTGTFIAVAIILVVIVVIIKRKSLMILWTKRKRVVKNDPEIPTTAEQTDVGNKRNNSTLMNEVNESERSEDGESSSSDSGLECEKIGSYSRDRKQGPDENGYPLEDSKQGSDENSSLSEDNKQDFDENSSLSEDNKQDFDENSSLSEDSKQDCNEYRSLLGDSKLGSDMNGSFLNDSVHDACSEETTPRKRTKDQSQVYDNNY